MMQKEIPFGKPSVNPILVECAKSTGLESRAFHYSYEKVLRFQIDTPAEIFYNSLKTCRNQI